MKFGFLIGVIAMGVVVVASNVLVQFVIPGGLLTWGAFTYPLAFLVTDVINRRFGLGAARRVMIAGLAFGVVCSLIGSRIMLEFGPAVPLRIAVASAVGFLAGQFLDTLVFDRMRAASWWRAPLVSSLAGSFIDSLLFFSIAFSAQISFGAAADADVAWAAEAAPLLLLGPEYPLWVSLGIADWLVKLAVAFLALAPFRWLTSRD